MELYTEEQMIQAYELGLGLTHEEVMEQFVPIQLPTDEDIHRNRPYESISDWGIGFHSGWKEGAKWMRDKIQGGQDE